MIPTTKQLNYVSKITAHLGNENVEDYFYKHFPNGNYLDPTKSQAQKLITGLGHRIAKPVYGVYGRDVF